MATIQFQAVLRRTGNLTILFRDKHTTIAQEGSTALLFHRWYDRGLGDYADKWKPFTRALKEQKIASLADCRRLAYKHGIDTQSYAGGLSVPDNIKIIGEQTNGSGENLQRTSAELHPASPTKAKVEATSKQAKRTRPASTRKRKNLSRNNKRAGAKK